MRRATWWSALLVGLALMATTGCGTDRPAPGQAGGTGQATSGNQATSGDQSAPGNQATSGGSTSGRSAPAGTGGTASGAVLIDFGRQGGIAGVTDQLVVREDGGYTLTRARPAVNRSGQ